MSNDKDTVSLQKIRPQSFLLIVLLTIIYATDLSMMPPLFLIPPGNIMRQLRGYELIQMYHLSQVFELLSATVR